LCFHFFLLFFPGDDGAGDFSTVLGLILSQYWHDQRTVTAKRGSEFYQWLGCEQELGNDCEGTVEQFVWVFFGEKFNWNHIYQDVLILALYLLIARVATFFALRKFQYTNT